MYAMNKNKRLFAIILAVPVLLLIPLVAMQFSAVVSWSLFDFIVMGILLLGVGLSFEFVLRKISSNANRIALIAIILALFFLIWAELAVGIFGTTLAGS